ncbi:DUF2335 domain-containing protein [Puia dinghuensis]|uniref:DUF2335 domain-containing protein n=1 Tax=Puia dinghuensis TaxID=1792502 RepID=A0A8J2UEJ9_9BACT|nr:DUF2335 domain-containing protein [Puia dinghuensis]GGB06798.1 hypothetical protein GCM10011511_32840 [Puia dinghuensis]
MSIPPLEENFPVAPRDYADDGKPDLPPKILESLEGLSQPQRDRIIAAMMSEIGEFEEETSVTHFSGPLPPPDILRQMNEIVPGAAAQIINMTVSQSEHRKAMEKCVVEGQTKQSRDGQRYGFAIAIIVILISGFLVYNGHDIAGTILGGVDLVALVAVFVTGKASQKSNLKGGASSQED